jgi:hypothetical protein
MLSDEQREEKKGCERDEGRGFNQRETERRAVIIIEYNATRE